MRHEMQPAMSRCLRRFGCGRLFSAAALIGAGLFVGSALPLGSAWGDVKDAAPAQAFQTGGQLSVPLLKEIAATLQQMDARLSRMETIAQQLRTTKTMQPAVK
jgi:hypothetical protein